MLNETLSSNNDFQDLNQIILSNITLNSKPQIYEEYNLWNCVNPPTLNSLLHHYIPYYKSSWQYNFSNTRIVWNENQVKILQVCIQGKPTLYFTPRHLILECCTDNNDHKPGMKNSEWTIITSKYNCQFSVISNVILWFYERKNPIKHVMM